MHLASRKRLLCTSVDLLPTGVPKLCDATGQSGSKMDSNAKTTRQKQVSSTLDILIQLNKLVDMTNVPAVDSVSPLSMKFAGYGKLP